MKKEQRLKANAVAVKKSTATTEKLKNLGYTFNMKSIKKIERIANKDLTSITKSERDYLMQFSTIGKATKKATGFIDYATGTKMSKSAGKILTSSTNKVINELTEGGFSELEATSLVSGFRAITNPKAFVKDVIKEGAKFVANTISESAGFGELGGAIVDGVTSVDKNKDTKVETQAKEVQQEAREETPTEENNETKEQSERRNQLIDRPEADEMDVSEEYKDWAIKQLSKANTLYCLMGDEYNSTGPISYQEKELTAIDVSGLSGYAISYLQSNLKVDTQENINRYLEYYKNHTVEEFSKRYNEATQPMYTDDPDFMYSRYESFIEWVTALKG